MPAATEAQRRYLESLIEKYGGGNTLQDLAGMCDVDTLAVDPWDDCLDVGDASELIDFLKMHPDLD